MTRKLFTNVKLITPLDPGKPLAGTKQGDLLCFERGALICRDGKIEAAGDETEIGRSLAGIEIDEQIDCRGLLMLPGFVDPHTHMCFADRREEEFEMRLQGLEYLEILARGGGILSSVRAVEAASDEDLFGMTRRHALSALRSGTTTLEMKSGYGLRTDLELKM